MVKDSNGIVFGFVGVLGYPNVGKSTLVNQLVGEKVAIVSERPGTTRNRIRGILNTDDAQIVFVDTPGIQRPRDKMEKYMEQGAKRTVNDVDVIMLVVDGSRNKPGLGDKRCADVINKSSTPAILVVNKLDLVDRQERDQRIETYSDLAEFEEVIPASALYGHNLDMLRWELLKLLPDEEPRYFPEDMKTDQPVSFLVAELIREKVLELTQQEVPHSTAVQLRQIEEREDDFYYVAADIIVERESQKGILIGNKGRMIRAIGKRSRKEVEKLLEVQIFLDLHVRLQKNWRESASILRELGISREPQ